MARFGWSHPHPPSKRPSREDFLARYPLVMTEDNYVDALNLNAGGVLAPGEREALIGGLGNGSETRATVLRKIADNTVFHQNEYNAAFVMMQYFGYCAAT